MQGFKTLYVHFNGVCPVIFQALRAGLSVLAARLGDAASAFSVFGGAQLALAFAGYFWLFGGRARLFVTGRVALFMMGR